MKRPLRIDKIGIDGLLGIFVSLGNLEIQDQPLSSKRSIYCPNSEYEQGSWEESQGVDRGVPQNQRNCRGQEQQEELVRGQTTRGEGSISGDNTLHRRKRGDEEE